MGIYYKAAIFYGLPRHEIEVDDDRLEELQGNCEIDECSMYYDADNDDCLFGYYVIASPDYGAVRIPSVIEHGGEVEKFTKIFGKPGRLYLSTCGW